MKRYFLTVDWCRQGRRGVFCSRSGGAFIKDDAPHTREEMDEILGLFWVVLSPKSESFTEEQLAQHAQWTPLDEYSGAYGVARRAE